MKHSVLAIALLGAFGVASAQSSVAVYGTLDAGMVKKTDATLAVGKRDNNKLGFKGTEDLGNGLQALFQLEIRYEPDTGTVESNSRPLFQGQSRVGLQGAFGMVRLGRGTTALMDSIDAFDPWNGVPSTAGFKTDLTVAGYSSDPLSAAGNSGNRFSNAVFYNSPVMGGFQVNATVGTKESNASASTAVRTATVGVPGDIPGRGSIAFPQYAVGAEASASPYSLSATYKGGPFAALAAYERNAIETTIWALGASFMAMPDLKLMGTYSLQDRDHTTALNPQTKAWVLGANYAMGPGKLLAGYGQKTPDGAVKVKEMSLGYEYSLSKRTYVYLDVSDKKAATDVKFYSVGVHHNF